MLRGHTFRSLNHAHDHFFGGDGLCGDITTCREEHDPQSCTPHGDPKAKGMQKRPASNYPFQRAISFYQAPPPKHSTPCPQWCHKMEAKSSTHTHTLLNYAEDPGRAGAIVPMILVSLASVHDITGLLLMGFRVG